MAVNFCGYKRCMAAALFLLVNGVVVFAQPDISATDLCLRYKENEVRFEQDFKGKVFYITGKITAVDQCFLVATVFAWVQTMDGTK